MEGRNGQLSLKHHALHQLTERKLQALTVLHNYAVQREDGSTAAERFYGAAPRDLFAGSWNTSRCPPGPGLPADLPEIEADEEKSPMLPRFAPLRAPYPPSLRIASVRLPANDSRASSWQGYDQGPADGPHPNPLPEGEGTGHPQFATLHSLNFVRMGKLRDVPPLPLAIQPQRGNSTLEFPQVAVTLGFAALGVNVPGLVRQAFKCFNW